MEPLSGGVGGGCDSVSTLPLYPFGDEGVRNTNDDAASSKLSSVNLGYYQDKYLHYFVTKATRRVPLINKGYYSRVAAIRQLITQFFDATSSALKVQIISFGGGLDTTQYWVNDKWSNFIYFDVDFPEVIPRKTSIVLQNEELWRSFAESKETLESLDSQSIRTEKYRMVPVDIRGVPELEDELLKRGFDRTLPTLMLFECVLVYMQSLHSDLIIKWTASAVSAASACIVYEQVSPNDAFGATMVRNLKARGCPLLGIYDYPTIQAQKERYVNLGWKVCTIADMNQVHDHFVDRADRERIQKLEIFDEIEEWRLIQSHYMIVVAVNDGKDGGVSLEPLKSWAEVSK